MTNSWESSFCTPVISSPLAWTKFPLGQRTIKDGLGDVRSKDSIRAMLLARKNKVRLEAINRFLPRTSLWWPGEGWGRMSCKAPRKEPMFLMDPVEPARHDCPQMRKSHSVVAGASFREWFFERGRRGKMPPSESFLHPISQRSLEGLFFPYQES